MREANCDWYCESCGCCVDGDYLDGVSKCEKCGDKIDDLYQELDDE